MIEFKSLTKKYGEVNALQNLTLTIQDGTVLGLVGSNGAGKSTTFSILSTLLAPTSGDAYIDDISVVEQPEKARQLIGYMPDFFGVYDQLKVDEYLDFYASSYGITATLKEQLISDLLALVNLSDKRFEYVDNLSRGMKQRLCLARTLIHSPRVLILDEPASGLDPIARAEMRDIMKRLKDEGKTILISSHILPELADMCDEIAVLDKGKLIAHGNVHSIQAQLQGEKRLHVCVTHGVEIAQSILQGHDKVKDLLVRRETLSFNFLGVDHEQTALLKALLEAEVGVLTVEQEVFDLEDIFIAITKGEMLHENR
ncbi:MAG: ABC transporter ATP-binding protein [Lysinibacillus sp.]